MKNKDHLIKMALILLVLAILICKAVFPESNLGKYIAPGGIALAMLFNHIFMPQFANLPNDNPKVKTMRRINMLVAVIMAVLFIVNNLLPERTSQNEDKFILPFSVLVIMLVGNAAPKLPMNGIIGIRLPWTRRNPDTWRVAHRVLGYCTFPITFIMIAGGLLIDPVAFSVGGLLAFALIPSGYSFIYDYKKRRLRKEN